jgi:hypothetical protein
MTTALMPVTCPTCGNNPAVTNYSCGIKVAMARGPERVRTVELSSR